MLKRLGTKLGDTLIEVTLAVGIFSMIAIAVVSVVSASTTGAQTALETTLTREEIDTQAEALRFIHGSYASSLATSNEEDSSADMGTFYSDIWKKITEKAITKEDGTEHIYVPLQPATCQAIYDTDEEGNSELLNHAFVIDPRQLANKDANPLLEAKADGTYSEYFRTTTTFPRLAYEEEDDDNDAPSSPPYVEGIYVLAVKDPELTIIVDDKGDAKETTAYYDFYIRSCWYSAGADTPNTIATIIRLYNPDAIHDVIVDDSEDNPELTYTVRYNANNGTGNTATQEATVGEPITLRANTFKYENHSFLGWDTSSSANNVVYHDSESVSGGLTTVAGATVDLYAVWEEVEIQPTCTRYMQDFNSSSTNWCNPGTLIDKRDNQSYTVAKISGKYWMTKNLNIAGGTTLNSTTTNMTSGTYTLPQSSLKGFKSSTEDGRNWLPYVYNSNSTNCSSSSGCYSYYSYAAAALGMPTAAGEVTNDICPKNWKLPSSSDINALISDYGGAGELGNSPFNGVYADEFYTTRTCGYYDNEDACHWSNSDTGYYWSSTVTFHPWENGTSEGHLDAGYMRIYSFYKAGYSDDGYYTGNGYSVRCVNKL